MSHAVPAATGGFVSRAERSPTRNLAGTQPVVGPGSYEVIRSAEVNPAPAPFHTSTERVLAANQTTSAITPGPGAYVGPSGGPPSPTSGPVSSFVSGVPRLPTDAESRARRTVPGPGSYDTGNEWVQGGPRYRAQGGSAAAARVQQLLPRRRNAPSVPGRGESYGYEEDADGTLVLQAAPEKTHTGMGADKVGPGSYELAGPVPFSRPSGTAWGRSKAKRSAQYGPPTPGVGAYNVADSGPRKHGAGLLVSIGGVEVVFGGTTGTSSFVSKAPRPLQKMPEPAPGPGDYDLAVGPSSASAAGGSALRPAASAVFGTSGVRGMWEVDPTRSRAAATYWKNPGPGAYDDPRVPTASHGRRSVTSSGPAIGNPFQSTTLRFGSSDNAVPGPGDYHPDAVTSLEFDVFKKVSISRPAGGFGGSTGRFPYNRGACSPARLVVPGVVGSGQADEGGATPGPAHYEPKAGSGRPTGRSGTSNFASRTGRFRPVTAPPAVPDLSDFDGTTPLKGDPSRLGPGAYSPEQPTGRPRYTQAPAKAAPFGTEAGRAKMELPSKANPGPGRYSSADPAAAFKPVTAPPPKTGFSSQADRFGASTTFTPGPGSYAGGAGSALVRKSYNVTYSGTLARA